MSPPSAGFSIFHTSAPRSASCIEPYGPAPYCSTAITRRPERTGSMPLTLSLSPRAGRGDPADMPDAPLPESSRPPRPALPLPAGGERAGVRGNFSSACLPSHLVPGDQLAGDDDALQFVGALADHQERRVAVEALDGELLRIAVAAMDAHRFEADG